MSFDDKKMKGKGGSSEGELEVRSCAQRTPHELGMLSFSVFSAFSVVSLNRRGHGERGEEKGTFGVGSWEVLKFESSKVLKFYSGLIWCCY